MYNTGCTNQFNQGYIARIFLDGRKCNLGTFDSAIHAAAYRDEIAWMYRKLDLLNHTGITAEEALQHRRSRYNSIDNIRASLPPVEMCAIVNNSEKRTMCYIINTIERGY
jgi:hypothetical protein